MISFLDTSLIFEILRSTFLFEIGGFNLPGELPPKDEMEDVIRRIIASVLLLVALCLLSFWQKLRMEKLFVFSYIRGFLQIIFMAAILIILFGLKEILILFGVLLFMCAFSAYTTKARFPSYPNILNQSMISITVGSFIVMVIVVAVDIIPSEGSYVIPLGAMVVSNAMVITNIVIERFTSSLQKSKGMIEAALSLGDSASNSVRIFRQEAFRAGLLPSTNRVAILGIVNIPGLMAGMIIGGANPIVAAVYQVIIFLMLMTAAFISMVIMVKLLLNDLFTDEDQLKATLPS
ncbi:MAG: ABC transporter permease [Candidatus Thorarchaeota archaeon]